MESHAARRVAVGRGAEVPRAHRELNVVGGGGQVLPPVAVKELALADAGVPVAVKEFGPGRLLDSGSRAAMSLVVGNKVVFKKYSPDEVKIDDEEFLVISESDVMAVIE
jgi:chaperonin GroES